MSEIARKHIDISLAVKQVTDRHCKDCKVYIATYTTGKAGQTYQCIEEQSGEEFWSIKAWTPPPPPRLRLKDPDVIIIQDDRVKYLVEVKWGAVPGCASTDLLMSPTEWAKMSQLLYIAEFSCRVRGPAVKNGCRYASVNFESAEEYKRDTNSKFVLVSDFNAAQQNLESEFQEFLTLWRSKSPRFQIADININVDEIPSLVEVLAA